MFSYGLEVVAVPESPQFVNLVCVHGYGGEPDSTWHDDETGKTWVTDDAFLNHIGSHVRVLTFRYNSSVAANLSAASIAFHAADLLSSAEAAIEKCPGRPLVFLAHGFGGLIVKKAIILSTPLNFPRLFKAVAGVIFLGTPHTATRSDALLHAIRENAAAVQGGDLTHLDGEFRAYAVAASRVNEQFPKYCPEPRETVMVSQDCSDKMPANVDVIVDCDHADLARFSDAYDPRFLTFASNFNRMLAAIRDKSVQLPLGPPPPSAKPPIPAASSTSTVKSSSKGKSKRKPKSKPDDGFLEKVEKTVTRHHEWLSRERLHEEERIQERFLASLDGWSERNLGANVRPDPGTCQWFKDDEGFTSWLSSPDCANLIYHAPGGRGKTFLAAAIATHLRKVRPDDLTLSFFCTRGDAQPAVWDYFTQALLRERRGWFSHIKLTYRDRDRGSPALKRWEVVDLWTSFRRSCAPVTIYLIVDGLDQAGYIYLQQFIDCVEQIQAANMAPQGPVIHEPGVRRLPPTNLKVLFTCYMARDVNMSLNQELIRPIPTQAIEDDIHKFVDANLNKISKRYQQAQLAEFGTIIKRESQCFWIYADCAIAELDKAPYLKPSFVDGNPVELDRWYDVILRGATESVEDPTYICALIDLLSSHSLGPMLEISELEDALEWPSSQEGHGTVEQLLLGGLGDFICLADGGGLSFSHTSAGLYLSQRLTAHQRATNMACLCLEYLLRDHFRESTLSDYDLDLNPSPNHDRPWKKHSFYGYASSCWVRYVALLDHIDTRLELLLKEFLCGNCPQYNTWVEASTRFRHHSVPSLSPTDSPLLPLLYAGASGFFYQYFPAPGHSSTQKDWLLWTRINTTNAIGDVLGTRHEDPSFPVPDWASLRHCGDTALVIAASTGKLSMVKYLLEWRVDANHRGEDGMTALKSCIVSAPPGKPPGREQLWIAAELLAHGADPNVCDEYGVTPFLAICHAGNLLMAEIFLSAGAKMAVADLEGHDALFCACVSGNPELIAELVYRGADVDIARPLGGSLLIDAVNDDDLAMFRALLPASSDINRVQEGFGALHLAATTPDRHEFLLDLLERPDLDLDARTTQTALEVAIANDNHQAADLLLQAGATACRLPGSTASPLIQAIQRSNVVITELLLAHHVPVNEFCPAHAYNTALAAAVGLKQEHIVSLLLQHGGDPTVEDGHDVPGPLLLALAATPVDKSILAMLLDARVPADVNFIPPLECHALIKACEQDDEDIVRVLLEHGADTRLWTRPGQLESPVIIAAEAGRLKILEVLLDHDPGLLDAYFEIGPVYQSPLQAACVSRRTQAARLLLSRGAKVDKLSFHWEESALFCAMNCDDLDIVQMILAAAPDMVDVPTLAGSTPLSRACQSGNVAMVKLLLDAGASFHPSAVPARNCVFESLFSGKHRKAPDILELLIQRGLDLNSFVTINKLSILGAAVERGTVDHVKWLLAKGADPLRCHQSSDSSGTWINALAWSIRVGDLEKAELLWEPTWGLRCHLTDTDPYGENLLHAALSPPVVSDRAVAWIVAKCDEVEAGTGRDVLSELMSQKSVFAITPVDHAMDYLYVADEAVTAADQVILSQLEQILRCERTWSRHRHLLYDIAVSLSRRKTHYEDVEVLLSAAISKPTVRHDPLTRPIVVARTHNCGLCGGLVSEVCYLCTMCHEARCWDCGYAYGGPGFHTHFWLEVPLVVGYDLNSAHFQEMLERVHDDLSASSRGNGVAKEATEPNSAPPSLRPAEMVADEIQSGLQLATLHAFNLLAVRKSALTPYLPLSSFAEKLISPFADVIAARRKHLERRNLWFESSVRRCGEEAVYFSRVLRKAYVDEDLVRKDMIVIGIRDLLQPEDEEDGDVRSRKPRRESSLSRGSRGSLAND
ncbi:hypothetical protein S40288_04127 [Stachybotrys chartarum IBT 40288]|nr:hypothetical protein S40288_04127 [Stachybotrys chartarum IBT 40288]